MRLRIGILSMGVTLALSLAPADLTAQMEKRDAELYERQLFEAAFPAVGSEAPELVMVDVSGRPWSISGLRGRIVVLIKGGYT